ncbi:hypothetical protein EV1_037133 [Malus domestica]
MGSGVSTLSDCFRPVHRTNHHQPDHNDVVFAASEPLDETLGHSFCYVRNSARFLSPTQSDRFISPSNSLRFSPPHESSSRPDPDCTKPGSKPSPGLPSVPIALLPELSSSLTIFTTMPLRAFSAAAGVASGGV